MTEAQWSKIVERLRKYREVKMPDGNLLILWDNGDVSLRDGSDGHCIECSKNLNDIKRIYVRPERRKVKDSDHKSRSAALAAWRRFCA